MNKSPYIYSITSPADLTNVHPDPGGKINVAVTINPGQELPSAMGGTAAAIYQSSSGIPNIPPSTAAPGNGIGRNFNFLNVGTAMPGANLLVLWVKFDGTWDHATHEFNVP